MFQYFPIQKNFQIKAFGDKFSISELERTLFILNEQSKPKCTITNPIVSNEEI